MIFEEMSSRQEVLPALELVALGSRSLQHGKGNTCFTCEGHQTEFNRMFLRHWYSSLLTSELSHHPTCRKTGILAGPWKPGRPM